MLCLKSKPKATLIDFPTLSSECSVKRISRVELHTGFGRPYLHDASGCWFIGGCGLAKSSHFAIDDPRVVIATPELELLIILIDARADNHWFQEIEGCALHISDFTRGNGSGI